MCLSTPLFEECGWDPGKSSVRWLRRSPSLFCDILVSMNFMGFSLHTLRKTLEAVVRPTYHYWLFWRLSVTLRHGQTSMRFMISMTRKDEVSFHNIEGRLWKWKGRGTTYRLVELLAMCKPKFLDQQLVWISIPITMSGRTRGKRRSSTITIKTEINVLPEDPLGSNI